MTTKPDTLIRDTVTAWSTAHDRPTCNRFYRLLKACDRTLNEAEWLELRRQLNLADTEADATA